MASDQVERAGGVSGTCGQKGKSTRNGSGPVGRSEGLVADSFRPHGVRLAGCPQRLEG